MTLYERFPGKNTLEVGARVGLTRALICATCGALVIYDARTTHNAWHEQLDMLTKGHCE